MKKKKHLYSKKIRILSLILFIGSAAFLLYYMVIQPMYSKQINEKYRDIYYSNSHNQTTASDNTVDSNSSTEVPSSEKDFVIQLADTPDGSKNSDGILLKFEELLDFNPDVKGWLSIEGTGIDYPVLQDAEKSNFYLDHDFEGTIDKNGSLYIDGHCSVDNPTKNIVIHGHNMASTHMMFYELVNYNDIDFYKEHPIITFDSIYDESKWLIFALLRVSGQVSRNYGYNFMTGTFENDEDFMNFVYQTQIRSLYHCPVSVNEDDTLLMLSTCSYEINDARTIVVARKVREDEVISIDTNKAYLKDKVLYPEAWYKIYKGEAPTYTTFTDALNFKEIDWYDGKIESEVLLGEKVIIDDSIYEITSGEAVKFVGVKKKKIDKLNIPDEITLESGRKLKVTELSKGCFDKLTKLEELKIGDNISKIPEGYLTNCNSLTSVTLGKGVTTISKKAFEGLTSLKKIVVNSEDLQTVGNNAFKNIHPKATIKLKKYKQFKNLITESGIDEGVEIVKQ